MALIERKRRNIGRIVRGKKRKGPQALFWTKRSTNNLISLHKKVTGGGGGERGLIVISHDLHGEKGRATTNHHHLKRRAKLIIRTALQKQERRKIEQWKRDFSSVTQKEGEKKRIGADFKKKKPRAPSQNRGRHPLEREDLTTIPSSQKGKKGRKDRADGS